MTNSEHLPPQNIAAEEAVLGAILMDANALFNIATFLRPEHFYREKNRWLYETVLRLRDRREPVDFLTVCTELEQKNQLADVGGPAYLAGLVDATPSAAHAVFHARMVERTAILRRLISVGGQIAALAYESAATVEETLDKAEQLLFGVSQQRAVRDLVTLSEALAAYYERLEQLHRHQGQMLGLPTGFFDLDALLGGLQKSDLVIIASRPSVGKTSLGLALARQAAMAKQCVAVFSLEMSAEQLVQRLVAAETQIDAQRLRLGDVREGEWPLLVQAIGNMSDLRLFIDDTPAISPLELRTKCRRLYAEHGLNAVVVDYLQLMSGGLKSENRVQEISYISRALKSLARELDIPVIALSQLNRAVETRTDRRPLLADLRESGSIEQDADVVMLLYRAAMYYPDEDSWRNAFPSEPYPENIAEIHVAKHRNGPTGKIELGFLRQQAKFVNLSKEEMK